MTWIKRNLFFLIGSTVAVALMGLAGWYLFAKWQDNDKTWNDLNEVYSHLDALSKKRPHPGSGAVDNIKAAKEQKEQLADWVKKARETQFKAFTSIPPAPVGARRITDRTFSIELARTISEMQHAAQASSVTLQPEFAFGFSEQKRKLSFAPNSIPAVSAQLGQVKTICDVLFAARINALDYVRRERVSPDDFNQDAPATDYLDATSVTNGSAVLTSYQLTFRCFSSELAAVMAGFANGSNVLVVKAISVEPATAPTGDLPAPPSTPIIYNTNRPPFRGGTVATNAPSRVVRPTPGGPTAGLATVIDEKQLQVDLLVQAIQLRN